MRSVKVLKPKEEGAPASSDDVHSFMDISVVHMEQLAQQIKLQQSQCAWDQYTVQYQQFTEGLWTDALELYAEWEKSKQDGQEHQNLKAFSRRFYMSSNEMRSAQAGRLKTAQ